MYRRDVSKALFAVAAGSTVVTQQAQAQTCTAPCYPPTDPELAAGVIVTNQGWPPGTVDRYGTNTTPGVTDMTSAITGASLAWSNGGPSISFQKETYAVASNLTVNAPLIFMANAQVKPAAGIVLTLNGSVTAPAMKIFNLASGGSIQGRLGGADIYTRWYGDVADGNYDTGAGTDNAPAFNAALATAAARAQSFTTTPNRLVTLAGIYACQSTVSVGSNINWVGAGKYATIIFGPSSSSYPNGLIAFTGSGTYPTKFSGFAVLGQVNGSSGCGIVSTKNGTFISDVWVAAWGSTTSSVGIIINQTTNYLTDFVCELNSIGIQVGSQGSDITISNGETYQNAQQGILIANAGSTDVGRTIVSHVRLARDVQSGVAVSAGRHVTIDACSCQSDRSSDFNSGAFAINDSNDVILVGCTAQVPSVGGGAGPGFSITGASTNVSLTGCVATFMSVGVASTGTTVLNISGGIYSGSATDGIQINGGDQINIVGVSTHNNSGNGINDNASTAGSKHAVQCCMSNGNNVSGLLLTAMATSFINCVGSTVSSNTSAGITKAGTVANINIVGSY